MTGENQKIVVFSLLGALVLAWLLVLGPLGGKKTTPAKQTTSQEEEEGLNKILKQQDSYQQTKEKIASFTYERSEREPFYLIEEIVEDTSLEEIVEKDSTPTIPQVSFANFKLTGIAWDPEDPLAIVNGKMVKKGTRIEGVTVKEILVDRVILECEGQKHILTMKEKGKESKKTGEESEEEEEKTPPPTIF